MKKKTIFIIIILILIISFISMNTVYARVDTESITIADDTRNDFQEAGNKILGVVKVIVAFVAVAGAMILGVRYMMASVEEKAQIHQTLVLYVIGVVLAFGIVGIVEIVSKLVS